MATRMRTSLTRLLEIEHPIVACPLGPDLSGPQLAAAISNGGGLGMLRAPDQENPARVKELIRETRELTSKPFGIGIVLAFPHEGNVQAALEENIPVLQVYWGTYSKEQVDIVHKSGAKIIHQVGSVAEAQQAASAGVDIIQVQGFEAGGHVIGQASTMALVPCVVDAVSPVPVIASGGIADARGLVAALALGAEGVAMGTRFLATTESNVHPLYKEKIVNAAVDGTQYTNIFGRARWPGAPHRCLKTDFVDEWHPRAAEVKDESEGGLPTIGQSTIHNKEVEIKRFSGTAPNASTEGAIDNMPLYAGQSAGLVREIQPAAVVIQDIVRESLYIIMCRMRDVLQVEGS
eukprot:TRINITY_DN23175_c0_g1_i1.p1 TRINITY_DN23175_c0_g1~~TRINITY_DN23175_c0_g1_i1.p1  ORF type:complete len:348 (+),score=46.84 TRINITY_DN23175_c0_g1_i1:328-1371(+)